MPKNKLYCNLKPDKRYLILRCVVPTGINTFNVFYRVLPDGKPDKDAAIKLAEKCCEIYRRGKGFSAEMYKKKYPNIQQVHYATGKEYDALFRDGGRLDDALIKKTDRFFNLSEDE